MTGEQLLANGFGLCDYCMPAGVFQDCGIVVIIVRSIGEERLIDGKQEIELCGTQMSVVPRKSKLISVRIRTAKLYIRPVRTGGRRCKPSSALIAYIRNFIDGAEPLASKIC